jgi:hypothetical protein
MPIVPTSIHIIRDVVLSSPHCHFSLQGDSDEEYANIDFEGIYNRQQHNFSGSGVPRRVDPPVYTNVHERAARAVAASISSSTHAAAAAEGLIVLDGAVPKRFRAVLPYETLNKVQSRVFGAVFHDAGSVAVAAPTGTGKTALFELAIIRALIKRDESGSAVSLRDSKIVYLAPLRALCSERKLDWQRKFGPLGVNVVSVAGGDSADSAADVDDVSAAPVQRGSYDTDREAVSRAVSTRVRGNVPPSS